MEYKMKHKAWKELTDPKFVLNDIDLLKKKCANAKSLTLITGLMKHNQGRLEKEILYELLDHATPEEIIKNRKEKTATKTTNTMSANIDDQAKKKPIQQQKKGKHQKRKNTRR
jgi:hypothetical protein